MPSGWRLCPQTTIGLRPQTTACDTPPSQYTALFGKICPPPQKSCVRHCSYHKSLGFNHSNHAILHCILVTLDTVAYPGYHRGLASPPFKFTKLSQKNLLFLSNSQKIFRWRGLRPRTPNLSSKLYFNHTMCIIFNVHHRKCAFTQCASQKSVTLCSRNFNLKLHIYEKILQIFHQEPGYLSSETC